MSKNYQKKYNEALELARAYYSDNCNEFLDTIFPELKESEDERIRKAIMAFIKNRLDDGDGNPPEYLKNWLAWFEKQKEIPMPDSTQLIEWWDKEEAMLKGKDFRDDTWRIAQNAFMDGVFCGWRIKQKEQKGLDVTDFCKPIHPDIAKVLPDVINELLWGDDEQKEQKPVETSDFKTKLAEYLQNNSPKDGQYVISSESILEMAKEELIKRGVVQKPAEWSESDAVMCNAALALLRSHPNLMASNGINKSSIIRWLQSFRPQRKGFIDDICSKAGISIPYLDGNQWCILKGENIQSGVVGFGDTKEDALANFIKDVPISQQWSDEDNIGWDEAFACVTRAEKAAKNEEELQNAVTAEKWLKEIKFKYCVHPVKQEWSEEDEKCLQEMIRHIEHCVTVYGAEQPEWQRWLNLLNSLRPQPKQEWTEEDEKMRQSILNLISITFSKTYRKEINWLKSLPLNLKKKNEDVAKLCSTEWSEEDEKIAYTILNLLCSQVTYVTGQGTTSGKQFPTYAKERDWFEKRFKSLRPQPHKEIYQAAKHDLAIKFMNHLDENRPEGMMSLSNGECEDIDKAFKEIDWTKIIRYYEKYRSSWKPSEEHLSALVAVFNDPNNIGSQTCQLALTDLYEQLKKLKEE